MHIGTYLLPVIL